VAALLIFVISAAFCVYTLLVYPLLLWILSRGSGWEVHKAPLRATVTVVLPVFNGERWIGAKLASILELRYPAEMIEILVVDDGSTDGTRRVVESYASRARVQVLALPRGGKAVALNAAIARATGEILFFTDVRQSLDPDSLANLVACFADSAVGVVSGELVIRDSANIEEASVGLYWKYEKWIRKQLSRLDSIPGATGCIYAMRRSLARPLPPDTLVDDMFLPLGAFFAGYRVILDESARAFDYPTQLASEFRRKVRTLAGVYQVIGQYPALIGPGNRMWIHFVSHKLARLILPWALLAAAVSTLFLPAPWRTWMGAAQALVYGLALADYVLPSVFPLKRLTSPLRTFLVLMAASLCAVCILFVPPRLLWGQTRVSQSGAAT
jgi:cellulose synthase/poly-beta-1,6-N-acetylglucosamine synthase-like glycosyltransferase